MPRNLSLAVLLAFAVILAPAIGPEAIGCPMCKDTVAETPAEPAQNMQTEGNNAVPMGVGTALTARPALGAGFSYAILLMLAVPIVLVGGAGGAFYLAARKTTGRVNQP